MREKYLYTIFYGGITGMTGLGSSFSSLKIKKIIYAINHIESLNGKIRKCTVSLDNALSL